MSTELPPHLHYRHGRLQLEMCLLSRIAEEHGTPCYVYSKATLVDAYRQIASAMAFHPTLIAYAVKANSNLSLLRELAKEGAGADVVSGGELARALTAGIPADKIVFSGVGKTEQELEDAVRKGIASIHVESESELRLLAGVAQRVGQAASVCIRVNPDVDPQTHPYIATGLETAKFGLDLESAQRLVPTVLASEWLELEGIAMHIGSQLKSPEPLKAAVAITANFAHACVTSGARIRRLDVGGGWPADYGEGDEIPSPAAYGRAILSGLKQSGADYSNWQLVVEPGRSIVADAGLLLTKVLYIKPRGSKTFTVVDASMTELIRPSLYQAHHQVIPNLQSSGEQRWRTDVVGPVCETADFIQLDCSLPRLSEGHLLAVRGAGAYAASMSSNYNSRCKPAEVLVESDSTRLIRRRESYDDLWRHELMDGE